MLFTLKNFKKKNKKIRIIVKDWNIPCMRSLQREIKKEADHNRMVGEGKFGSFTQDLIVEEKQKAVSCT